MKISGFTIVRNAVLYDYPVVEAITSILPVVDEMIVLLGNSEDNTEELIRSIQSDKIRIHYSVWDENLKKGGAVLAVETDKAFQLISPDSDWAFYIQADEIIHEKYHDVIRKTSLLYKDDKRVEGLLFNYLHFYGTYDYVADSRKWYHKEVRIIRNDKGIHAYRDAQGFRRGLKKINVKPVEAMVYHYGWVKNPRKMKEKLKKTQEFWLDTINDPTNVERRSGEIFDFSAFDSLKHFDSEHPVVMKKRIEEKNWNIDLDISKKKFSLKEKLLYWYEKKTGKRLFDFRNYKII
ncbi:MAG TPA: glycosyltransferase family 2 protein [Puia sp.]|jgi:hypothetical protein|nr:glycosyltransferase family 2 protein [Puia sp.]